MQSNIEAHLDVTTCTRTTHILPGPADNTSNHTNKHQNHSRSHGLGFPSEHLSHVLPSHRTYRLHAHHRQHTVQKS